MIVDSELFDQLRSLAATLINDFDSSMDRVENKNHTADLEGWKDYFWESDTIRKAHLKTIEPVGKNKLWLMHINFFPREHVDLPIFGLGPTSTNMIQAFFFDPRNHLVEESLEQATQGNMKPFHDLLEVIKNPFSPPKDSRYLEPSSIEFEQTFKTFCGT